MKDLGEGYLLQTMGSCWIYTIRHSKKGRKGINGLWQVGEEDPDHTKGRYRVHCV
jgi:hypothetical protein